MTELNNRRYLLARLPEMLASGDPIGVVQIDVDYFKLVNDGYGHAAGDAVLRELCHLFMASRRDGDITVRWGGEEFLLLLQDVEVADVCTIAERLRCDIAARDFPDGRGGRIQLTCSIGFSMYPLALDVDRTTFNAAIELADLALYRAKQDGRNACVGLVATAPLSAEIMRFPFASQLDALLASGQLRWVREGS